MNYIVSYKWPGGMNTLEMALLLAVVTMPFDFVLNSYAIVLFAAAALLSNSPAEKITRLHKQPFFGLYHFHILPGSRSDCSGIMVVRCLHP